MVNKTQVQICASVFFLALSIAFVIIGALLPGQIIQPLINSGVKNSLPINANNFSPAYDYTPGSDWNKWVNTSLNSNFHVFNLTNLYDVLVNGAVPIYQDIQINVVEWQWKYNISYNADQTLVTFSYANFFVIQDQQSQDLLSKTIISPNPLYPAGSQQAQYQLSYLLKISTAGITASPPSTVMNFTDADLMGFYISTVVTTIQGLVTNSSSTLLQGFQILSIPAYFQTAVTIATTAGLPGTATAGQAVLHWAKLDGNARWNDTLAGAGAAQYAYLETGFELPTPITNPAVLSLIWTATQHGSLARDIEVWAQGLPGGAYYGSATLYQILNSAAYLNGTLNLADFQTILTWIGSALTPHAQGGFFENFQATVVTGVKQQLAGGALPYVATSPDIARLATFVDLGTFQFATGAITSLLLPTPVNFPTGTVDILGAAAGLGSATNVNNPEPIEIATACYKVNKPYYTTTPPFFTLADANAIFNGLTGATAVSLGLPAAGQSLFAVVLISVLQTQVLPSWQSLKAQLFLISPTPWTYFVDTFVETSLVNSTYSAYALPVLGTLNSFTFMNNQTTSQCFFDWMVVYLGNSMTGVIPNQDSYSTNSPYKIGADGVAPQNSGLFWRITIGEVLSGVKASATRLGQTAPGAMCDDFELIPYGTNQWSSSVMTNVINRSFLRDVGRQYVLYTGADDYTKTGLIYQTFGTRSFQGACQIKDPGHTTLCAGLTAGILPNTLINNYTVWNAVENLDKVSTAVEFPALQGDQQTLIAWVSNVARAVPFQLQGGLKVKDISTNQYYVDPSVYKLSYTTPNYWKSAVWNDQFSPDGTIDISSEENAPVIVSFPHFYGSDEANIFKIMTGMNPVYALHHSEIDVDPLTGLTIQAFKRLQANFKITTGNFVWNAHYTKNMLALSSPLMFRVAGDYVSYTYVPYYWGDQNNVISDSDNNKYYNAIIVPMKVANILQIVLPIVGGIGMIIFTITLYRSCTPRETSKTKYGDV